MKIVIAPDSFKESLSALEVAEGIETGFREVLPDAEYFSEQDTFTNSLDVVAFGS